MKKKLGSLGNNYRMEHGVVEKETRGPYSKRVLESTFLERYSNHHVKCPSNDSHDDSGDDNDTNDDCLCECYKTAINPTTCIL